MAVQWLRMINRRAQVLPSAVYIVLALALLDTVINRFFYFLARYPVWRELFASETLVRIGRLSFIFGDLASIFLLLLVTILMCRMKADSRSYIALPMIAIFAVDVLKYFLRTAIELSALTALLNLSSLAIILMAVLSRLGSEERRSSVKALAYVYLSLLTITLTLQHLHQLNLLISDGLALAGSHMLEVTPYLMLINAFAVSAYAYAVSRRDLPRILMKTRAFVPSLILASIVLGLFYVSDLVPHALPEFLTLVFGSSWPSAMPPLILIGLVFFLAGCLVLWVDVGRSYLYRKEAVGLLLIFTSVFLFGSIYYYPRVVLGIVLISVPLFERRSSTAR